MGVGLNTGPVCVVNLGSEQRFSYSAIGDAVKVASRVEDLSKEYGLPILMTENPAALRGRARIARSRYRSRYRLRRTPLAEPLPMYTLIGDDAMAKEPHFTDPEAVHARMIASYRAAAIETARTRDASAALRPVSGSARNSEGTPRRQAFDRRQIALIK